MPTVEFKLDIDDKVKVTPTGHTGIITMLGRDESGNHYYIKNSQESNWWPERHLEKQ